MTVISLRDQVQRARDQYQKVPRKYKTYCFVFWIMWKFVAFFLVAAWVASSSASDHRPITRVLYIVTSLAEYNTGKRKTQAGQDRLKEIMVPVLVDSVESLLQEPLGDSPRVQVDVALVLAYQLLPEREEYIRSKLPPGVGLMVWDDACPLGYEKQHSPDAVIDNTRALSRQHRYVIKDYFEHYDVFMAWEDDMRITGHHLQHFLDLTAQVDALRELAPATLPAENMEPSQMPFQGELSQKQLDRMIPGFIRVEVLQNETAYGAQTQLDPIDLDYNFHGKQYHFDPHVCCHVNMPGIDIVRHPKAADVVIWETSVIAFSARQLPDDQWVALLPGPGKHLDKDALVAGYWSGRKGAFGNEPKPSGGKPDLIAQQGGWMATKEQIQRLNSLCEGRFLPPFDEPVYKGDGQHSMNVEFWSGGYQFFTGVKGGCNFQRFVSLDPEKFSNHFIYHVANNKQKQLSQERMLRADHFFAQLNHVRNMAESEIYH